MAALFGLYVGATSASIAVMKEGKTEVLANDAGDRVTPAVVSYKDGEALVGLSALHQVNQYPSAVICYAKHQIGQWEGDNVPALNTCKPTVENGRSLYLIENNNNGKTNRVSVTVTQVLTLIFKKLMETARSAAGDANSHGAVVTVPTHFNADNRKVYRDAASAAGFNVVQIVKEPTAAVLAYESELDYKSETNLVVVRVGGTSMTVTTFKVTQGVYVVASSVVRRGLAGHLVTELIVDHLMLEVRKWFGAEVCSNARCRTKLRTAAENAKRVLSSLSTAQCLVESLYDGMDFQTTLTRARLDSILAGFLTKFTGPLEEGLREAGLDGKSVDFVILSGGSCRIPKIRDTIQQFFPAAQILGTIGPDEVIAVGAAVQASTLKSESADIGDECVPVAILSRGIYIKKIGSDGTPYMSCIFPSGPVIPSRKELHIHLNPSQKSVLLEVYEGDSTCEQNHQRANPVAKVAMKDLGGSAKLVASFNINSNLSLKISLTDTGTQRTETVTVDRGS